MWGRSTTLKGVVDPHRGLPTQKGRDLPALFLSETGRLDIDYKKLRIWLTMSPELLK